MDESHNRLTHIYFFLSAHDRLSNKNPVIFGQVYIYIQKNYANGKGSLDLDFISKLMFWGS